MFWVQISAIGMAAFNAWTRPIDYFDLFSNIVGAGYPQVRTLVTPPCLCFIVEL
jgi:hypothetical protein